MRIEGVTERKLSSMIDVVISVVSPEGEKRSLNCLLENAEFHTAGVRIVCNADPGELIIRTPEAADRVDRVDNDAAILDVLRLLHHNFGSLRGRNIKITWPSGRRVVGKVFARTGDDRFVVSLTGEMDTDQLVKDVDLLDPGVIITMDEE